VSLPAYVDALLDDLSSGDAEIVLLQFGAPQSRRLLYPTARAAAVFVVLITPPWVVAGMTVRLSPLHVITPVVWFPWLLMPSVA
jgi:hypothetical protein